MEVTLCPKSDFHTLGTGIVAELFQVLDVAVERTGLSVACTVAVVGEEPAEGHVVTEVTVNGSPGRELVTALFTVETFLDTAVVLLAFVVTLAVLIEHEAVFGGCPVVAVVGVEVTLIKAELGEQHGVAGELVEVVEQIYGLGVDHEEHVKIIFLMGKDDLALLGCAEIVTSRFESVPQESVAFRTPVEGCGRCHAAVHPVVGVLYGDGFAFVRETSVLHAAAIEVFAGVGFEGQCGAVLVEADRFDALHHSFSRLDVFHGHQSALLFKVYFNGGSSHDNFLGSCVDFDLHGRTASVVHEDFGRRRGLRITDDATVVVAEEAENVFAIKVEGEHFAVGIGQFHGGGIYFLGLADGG